jgi:hypothetical protein
LDFADVGCFTGVDGLCCGFGFAFFFDAGVPRAVFRFA